MLAIGAHLSIAKGLEAMGKVALEMKATTFQFFTRNPRGGTSKPYNETDVQALNLILKENHFAPVLAHAPYTLNFCAADPSLRNYAIETLSEDISRVSSIYQGMINLHPGCHVKQGVEKGIELIADSLNKAMKEEQKISVLLETMAGKGSEVGKTFEELKEIMNRIHHQEFIGVCLDTCHVHDAGYDIINHLDSVLETFDKVIGLQNLKAIHLNDSKNPCNSHKDRHELLGKGFIGIEALIRVINHPALRHLPFYLETPNDISGYTKEIEWMKSCFKD